MITLSIPKPFVAITTALSTLTDPLWYPFGDNTAGDGPMHECRSWHALEDYATAKSACNRDKVHEALLKEHFGYCDGGGGWATLAE